MIFLWFLILNVKCFDITETIDFSGIDIDSVEDFLTGLGSDGDTSSFSGEVTTVANRYVDSKNGNSPLENIYLSLKFSKANLDTIGDDAIQMVKVIVSKIKDSAIKAIFDIELAENPSANVVELTEEITSSSHLVAAMPDEALISTCLTMDNGDQMQINTHCGSDKLVTTITKCAVTDSPRIFAYHVSYSDFSCSTPVGGTENDVVLERTLTPDECGTIYTQEDALISIRNSVHVYTVFQVTDPGTGEVVSETTEMAATATNGVIIGCNHPIFVGSIEGEGNFEAEIHTWTDHTYSEINESRVTRLGSPIYFSVESSHAINGVYFTVTSCKFGTDTIEFMFLREFGCMYGPLHVNAHDDYLTQTGESQRFQYNAFVFRGHPYSGMKLTCEIEMCLQLSETTTCPDRSSVVCETNFTNE